MYNPSCAVACTQGFRQMLKTPFRLCMQYFCELIPRSRCHTPQCLILPMQCVSHHDQLP